MHFNKSKIKLILTNSNNYKNIEEAFQFFCKEINSKSDDVISEELQGEVLYIGIIIKKNVKSLNKRNIRNWLEKSINYNINVDILLLNENNVEISTMSNKFHLLQENYFENDFKRTYKKLLAKRKRSIYNMQEDFLKIKTNNDETLGDHVEDKKYNNGLYNLEEIQKDKNLLDDELNDNILIDLDNNKNLKKEIEKMFFLNNSSYYIEGLIYLIELPLTISQKYINKKLNLRIQLFENIKREKSKSFTFLNEKYANDLKNIFDSPPLLLNNVQWSSTFTSNVLYKKKKKKNSDTDDDDDEENNFFLNIYDEKNYKDSENNFPLNVNLHNICKSLNEYDEFMHKSNSKCNNKSLTLNKTIIVVKPLNIRYKIIDHYLYLEIENITKNNKIEIYELFSRSINIDSNIFPFSLYPEDMYSFFFPLTNFVQLLSMNNLKKKNSIEKKNSEEKINNTKNSKIIEKYKNNNEILTFCFNSDKTIISLCLKWCIDNSSNNFIWSQYCIEVEMPTQNLFNLQISFVKEINYSSILIAIFSFYNNHHEDIDLVIQIEDDNNLINNKIQSSLISFNSLIEVGVIKPYQYKSVNVKLLAIMLGLHNIPYVKIKNKLTNKVYLVDLGSILVTE
ncbi:conserved Plasmodium protein, unknown function [Plasmodium gallinaceum]|uniref:Trafficking protein particle complex subunit 13 C-terminal domain-containing protein n=1 Tax=Plasmodium gallinaceum TaxID=5849 RepID=A0A1J1GQR2_PLAGA|nr:conserved Plasmodium protein, unknown function [Plasmodium gallinaceum]CRG93623.1 conserved Plasmodium protein, unknown function [Plasmodium gallinaceum]